MLTDTAIRNAKPSAKPRKFFDGGGLCLLVAPAGGKWWRVNYRFGGRRKTISLGVYPDVSLTDARAKRDEARQLLGQGIDPSEARRDAKAREAAERLARRAASSVRVVAAVDGDVEIWKGRSMVRLMADEARAVKELFNKLIA
ncbi:MAG: Arm DNA-binding domain-containing protein [Gammaproteobacteria bacterium]